jgi:hypothetical protein
VGIGGTATNEGGYSRCLQVTGATEAALELKTGSSYSYLAQNGTTLQIRNNATSGVMTFATEATERMRIDSSGYVTINNSTSLNSVFSVYGKSNIAPCALQVNANGDYGYVFKNASGTLVGAIGVNASTTSYNTSSDYRLKENIVPMTGALATVSQLKPVTYKWKSTGEESQGFIAHELQEVVPDCVTGTKDELDAEGNPKYQGIDTSFLVATLTAAIQELKAELDELKAKVNA